MGGSPRHFSSARAALLPVLKLVAGMDTNPRRPAPAAEGRRPVRRPLKERQERNRKKQQRRASRA